MDERRPAEVMRVPQRQLARLLKRADEESLGGDVLGEEVGVIRVEDVRRMQDEVMKEQQREQQQPDQRPDIEISCVIPCAPMRRLRSSPAVPKTSSGSYVTDTPIGAPRRKRSTSHVRLREPREVHPK